MKTFLCFLMTCLSCLGAGYKISDLEKTNSVAGNVYLELDQGGIKSWAITVDNLFKAFGTNNQVTIWNITTNIANYQFVTNNVSITNYFTVTYTTNLTVYETNISNYQITTNLITYQTNISYYTITTNQIIYETNIVNTTITTNLYVTQNEYVSNLFTTNLYATNIYATNIYVTNLYVDNPVMGLQQLTNVAITNVANGEVLKWDDTMKRWTNSASISTFVVTNLGVITTNIAYVTNTMLDFSLMWNDYQQTNVCDNSINLCPTNLLQGSSFSLTIQGQQTLATNFSVYFTWPPYATVTWLSLTNGVPTTTITSNKLQFYSFIVRTNDWATNVIASFKEQP